jgi:hypothetical protein
MQCAILKTAWLKMFSKLSFSKTVEHDIRRWGNCLKIMGGMHWRIWFFCLGLNILHARTKARRIWKFFWQPIYLAPETQSPPIEGCAPFRSCPSEILLGPAPPHTSNYFNHCGKVRTYNNLSWSDRNFELLHSVAEVVHDGCRIDRLKTFCRDLIHSVGNLSVDILLYSIFRLKKSAIRMLPAISQVNQSIREV